MIDNNYYNYNEKDKPVVIGADSISGKSKGPYFCNICSLKLVLLNENTDKGTEWICNKCFISYFPNQEPMKQTSKLETVIGEDNNDGVLISHTPDADYDYGNEPLPTKQYKKEQLPPFYEMLKKKGFKITYYEDGVLVVMVLRHRF